MRIAFVSSEVFPYAKAGGLGDVSGALPKALQKLGHSVKVFLPNYSAINFDGTTPEYSEIVGEMPIRVSGIVHTTRLFKSFMKDSKVEIFFVDCPYFFDRRNFDGKPVIYTDSADEDERFILFQKAVIESLQRMQWAPDIINVNDWPTALIPLLIKDNYSWDRFYDRVATVISIHNIGYQGRFPKETMHKAEIRKDLFFDNSPIEVWGSICFLKAGLMYADAINTVSPTYAMEITTSEYGEGLEGVLHYRINDFWGILNGVDYSVWNPECDELLPYRYTKSDLSGKYENKKYLLSLLGQSFHPNVPLIGIISRLVSQKGFDLIADSISELMRLDAQWVILGSGERVYEELFRYLAFAYPDKVSFLNAKDEKAAHQIEAASDIFLMPSKYEPCGLNQIYSLKYGTIPIVRKTGGLADTVVDWDESRHYGSFSGNGFSFYDYTGQALVSSLERALKCYHQKNIWSQIVQNGMLQNYSWKQSAKHYEKMYEHAILKRKGN
jgi:starch synthase